MNAVLNLASHQNQATQAHGQGRLRVGLARNEDEIRRSQELRYQVFAGEMGAQLHSDCPGIDKDHFDDYCDHMLVTDEDSGRVVACSRILTDEAARIAGGFYSETEFDLSRILHPNRRYMEIGRTCVDPSYRGGALIALLWSGIGRYMAENDRDYLMGCVSIPMNDGGHNALSVMDWLRDTHMAAEDMRVYPKRPLPAIGVREGEKPNPPSLLKGYLRVGVKVCGDAFWDADFNVADVFVLLDRDNISSRYIRHFVKEDAQPVRDQQIAVA